MSGGGESSLDRWRTQLMGGAGRALACGDLIAEANPTFLSAESDFLMGLGELIFLAGGGTAGAFVCFLPMFRVLATSK